MRPFFLAGRVGTAPVLFGTGFAHLASPLPLLRRCCDGEWLGRAQRGRVAGGRRRPLFRDRAKRIVLGVLRSQPAVVGVGVSAGRSVADRIEQLPHHGMADYDGGSRTMDAFRGVGPAQQAPPSVAQP